MNAFVQSDSPLGLAAEYNHLYIVSWLLTDDGGADIDAQNLEVISHCNAVDAN